MDILKLVAFFAVVIALYFLCFSFPVKVNRDFMDTYHMKGWSWGFSLTIAVLILATVYEHGNAVPFGFCLVLTVMVSFFSVLVCAFKAQSAGASGTETALLAVSQLLSAVGVFFIILILFDISSEQKRKRKKR